MTDATLQILNAIQTSDPEACESLLNLKVPVNAALEKQTGLIFKRDRKGNASLTLIGLLNSILEKVGEPKVMTLVEDDDRVVGFTKRTALPE